MNKLNPIKVKYSAEYYVLKLKNIDVYFNIYSDQFYKNKSFSEYDDVKGDCSIESAYQWKNIDNIKAFKKSHRNIDRLFECVKVKRKTTVEYTLKEIKEEPKK